LRGGGVASWLRRRNWGFAGAGVNATRAASTLAAVHLPKTAGTSFLVALRQAFGEDLLLDYADRPLAHSRWRRRIDATRHAIVNAGGTVRARCVYGHFMPLKYSTVKGIRFSAWLRDPVQRVVSRYHHYVRHASGEPQHARWGLVPGLSLEQFARLPQYQNTYAEYFWMLPLSRFDFIGITEEYDGELARFARCFGISADLQAPSRNRNPDRQEHAAYAIDPRLDRLIRDLNARDVAIYEYARARR